MKKLFKEFKEFAIKGNVMDMAIGVIIGGAFGKIVTSFVNDVIMPPIGLILGGIDFSNRVLTLKAATADTEAVTLNYGLFVNTVIDFLIVAIVIFVVVKLLNKLKKKEEKKDDDKKKKDKPTEEVVLLREIRDLLKKKQ